MISCISYYSYIKPQPSVGWPKERCVVYRTIPTSNHNIQSGCSPRCRLYIVLFLHQTTTLFQRGLGRLRCISYYSYIKPQRIFRSYTVRFCCISYYSYIKPQLIDYPSCVTECCISYYSYIKPQHSMSHPSSQMSCISYYSYIKPQLRIVCLTIWVGCISYYSYIKPQQGDVRLWLYGVVYRTIPTSNHNRV